MSLTLFSSPGCHLCEQAADIIDYVGVTFEVVDISSNIELVRLYGIRIPVLKRSDGPELGWPFDTLDVERFTA
jgi:glutaredoxin